jgi:hypothetical protein
MKLLLSSMACVALLNMLSLSTAMAAPPCEDVLKDLRTKLATVHLADNDKSKVDELVQKGIARCNADDDKHADDLFDQATAIIGG